MWSCGIDVSGRAGYQQLCALGPDLVAAFPPPGTVEQVAHAVRDLGDDVVVAVDAPSGFRRDLLARGSALRERLGLPDGRYERSRVCDALLVRRRLPLYPVPSEREGLAAWQRWMGVGFALFDALAPLGLIRPDGGAVEAPLAPGDVRFGRLCETFPDAVFCALLGHRPPPKRTAEGRRARVGALRRAGVADPGLGLARRSLDELDACAAALAARGLATGHGVRLGDREEGVVVLPVARLLDRYERPVARPTVCSAAP
jgi:predicted nuclease with RNAse H fold